MKKLLILLLLIPFMVFSQIPKPQPNTYVNDLSGVLSTDQVLNLNKALYALEQKTTVQMAIVLVNDLPQNTTIEDYALQIGRQWHVGKANNGIVYVAVINAHQQRLEIAENTEGQITDIRAQQMTDALKPFFRVKDYGEGLNLLVQEVGKALDPAEQKALADKRLKKHDAVTYVTMITLIIFSALLLIWLFVVRIEGL